MSESGVPAAYFFHRLLLLVVLFRHDVLCAGNVRHHDWSYNEAKGNGPSSWHRTSEHCGGRFQSPVDIRNVRQVDYLTPLVLEGYDIPLRGAQLINNGHSVSLMFNGSQARLTGGCLDEWYNFAQLHFHWGKNSKRGSEHLLEGKAFPVEAHFVHVKESYGTLKKAVEHHDGLAVLGVFYQDVGKDQSLSLGTLAKALKNLKNAGEQTVLNTDSLTLRSLMPAGLSRFYCYHHGSLTTPPCSEAVIWTLLAETAPIGSNQLAAFRSLRFDDKTPMVDNFRPVQQLNDRVIFFQNSSLAGSSSSVLLAVSMLLLAVFAQIRKSSSLFLS